MAEFILFVAIFVGIMAVSALIFGGWFLVMLVRGIATFLGLRTAPPPAMPIGPRRPSGGRLPWGVLKSRFLGAISLGLLPRLAGSRGFRGFVIAEQQQLLHLAQWVRQNSSHPLARQLESDAVELRPGNMISLLSIFIVVATAVAMFLAIEHYRSYTPFDQLIAGTYGFRKGRFLD